MHFAESDRAFCQSRKLLHLPIPPVVQFAGLDRSACFGMLPPAVPRWIS